MGRGPKSEASRGGEDPLFGRGERPDAPHARSEERFRALVRALSSLVWTSAPDGQIIDMPEWRALTGMTVDEVRGWGWLNSLHPDDRARTGVVWQAAIDARSYYETEYRIRRWDGQYAWYQSRGVLERLPGPACRDRQGRQVSQRKPGVDRDPRLVRSGFGR